MDEFNTTQNDSNSNWFTQGSDAGTYSNDDIWAVRILLMEPNTHRSYGPHEGQHFFNHINEKLRILGEIPLRKFDQTGQPILDSEGNPDTSFLAKIPADTPFTFQLLDRNGLVLTMAQTWHQVRPGEVRANCGGCHAHSQQPLPFAQTAAAKADYAVWDLTKFVPVLTEIGNQPQSTQRAQRNERGVMGISEIESSTNRRSFTQIGLPNQNQLTASGVVSSVLDVEFYRDIRPILQRSCAGCHTGQSANPAGNLVLDDTALYDTAVNSGYQVPGDYKRLCQDSEARWGYPPVIGKNAGWRQTNASRYVRLLQARRSLLIWKVYGQRLDGWTNADHPTESIPVTLQPCPLERRPTMPISIIQVRSCHHRVAMCQL